jgi:hypothetical protein
MYRNKQYMKGVKGKTSTQIETRKGDGAATTFTMSYPISAVPSSRSRSGPALSPPRRSASRASTVASNGIGTAATPS